MSFALIHNNKVIQIADNTFPVSQSLSWVEIKPGVTVDTAYTYHTDTKTFNPPPEKNIVYTIDPIAGLLTALALYVSGTFTKEDVAIAFERASDTLNSMVVRVN
jgi:hypothetical protein